MGAAVLSDEVATARADVSYARFIDCPMPLTSLTAENQGLAAVSPISENITAAVHRR